MAGTRRRTRRPAAVRTFQMTVDEVVVDVVQKSMKTWRLTVRPPDGQVRMAVPVQMDETQIEAALRKQLAWIRRHRERLQKLPRHTPLEYHSGETLLYLGTALHLEVVERPGKAHVALLADRLLLQIEAGSSRADRAAAVERWMRLQLAALLPPLFAAWEPRLGVTVGEWRIRKMKTRWGTCAPTAGRIWINLHLIKRPPVCIEYLVVHEMAHLLERNHGPRFWALLDAHLPDWPARRALLNEFPLASL